MAGPWMPTMPSTAKARSRPNVPAACPLPTSFGFASAVNTPRHNCSSALLDKAGLTAHLGTNNMKRVEQRIMQGDKHAQLVVDAMIYHVAKHIAAESAVLCGKIDAILLTGGLARSDYVVKELRRRIDFLAPTYCYPGEDEMEALAINAVEVLRGHRELKEYV